MKKAVITWVTAIVLIVFVAWLTNEVVVNIAIGCVISLLWGILIGWLWCYINRKHIIEDISS